MRIDSNTKKYSNGHSKFNKSNSNVKVAKYEPGKIKTEDGYIFYRQSDGTYTDTKDGKNFDLSIDSYKKLKTIDIDFKILKD